MIRIETVGHERIYTMPRALLDVALDLFDHDDRHRAIFALARGLTGDDLHTVECIALNVGHAEALAFARDRLVPRKSALAIRI